MKKFYFFCFITFLFAPILSFSQNEAGNTGPGAAEISFKTKVLDYGTIKNNSEGDREFEFKNTGTLPLVINQCVGSCGCTVPRWPIDSIQPGEERSIKVHYATDRLGPIDRTITVYSNAKRGIDTLRIIGLVEFTKPSPSQYATSKNAKIFTFWLSKDSASISEQPEQFKALIDYIKLVTKDHKKINLFVESSTAENPSLSMEENYLLVAGRSVRNVKVLITAFRSNKLTPYVYIKEPIILVQGNKKNYHKRRKSQKYKYVKVVVD